MKTKFFGIFLLLLTSQALAGWTQVSKSIEGDIFYADFDRIKRHNGYTYYYMLGDYLTPKVGDLSVQYYRQVDCKSYRFRTISHVFYKQSMGQGTGQAYNESGDWETTKKGSINHIVNKMICNR